MNHCADTEGHATTFTCRSCGAITAATPIRAGEEICCDYTVDDIAVAEKMPWLRMSTEPKLRDPRCANPRCK
jgi:hypothetical protein